MKEHKEKIIVAKPTSFHLSEVERILSESTSAEINETAKRHNKTKAWKEGNNARKQISKMVLFRPTEEATKTNNALKIGRNEPCHCGSGKKFKKCHLEKQIIKKQ